jgi:hypothetical protein
MSVDDVPQEERGLASATILGSALLELSLTGAAFGFNTAGGYELTQLYVPFGYDAQVDTRESTDIIMNSRITISSATAQNFHSPHHPAQQLPTNSTSRPKAQQQHC